MFVKLAICTTFEVHDVPPSLARIPDQLLFYNSTTSCVIILKLCPGKQNYAANMFNLKFIPLLTSALAQMIPFSGQSEFTDDKK